MTDDTGPAGDEPSADALVRAFCAAWTGGSVDTLMSYFADDATYHNIPLDPAVGIDAIRVVIEGFMAMATSIEFEVLAQVATADLVMNERIDTIVMGDRTTALPVAGVFEVRDGRISAWRDYFDMGQFTGG